MEQTLTTRVTRWILDHKIHLVAVVFWIVLIIAVRQYMQTNDLTFGELTEQLSGTLTGEWYGPLIYIAVYLARPLILFPASLLTVLAGNVFGLWLGFVYGLLAGTLSAAVPYVVGRWFSDARDVEDLDEDASALKRFTGLMRRNPFQAILTMRLLYLPYDAVSLVAGNLRLPFIAFFLATALGNVAGTFAFVGIGASIEGDIAAGEISLNPVTLVVSGVILVVSLAISRYLNSRQKSSQQEIATEA